MEIFGNIMPYQKWWACRLDYTRSTVNAAKVEHCEIQCDGEGASKWLDAHREEVAGLSLSLFLSARSPSACRLILEHDTIIFNQLNLMMKSTAPHLFSPRCNPYRILNSKLKAYLLRNVDLHQVYRLELGNEQ